MSTRRSAEGSLVIGNRVVTRGEPCLVIAEAGSNHDRNLAQAHALIDAAADAGADGVKFQAFSADLIAAETKHEIAQIDFAGASTLHSLYKRAELPYEWLGELRDHCADRSVEFMCSPFDTSAVDVLESLDVSSYKVASFELMHVPLLRAIADTGKPVILSTGMATLSDIEFALDLLDRADSGPVALLHCVSTYPAEPGDCNLSAMGTMEIAFGRAVGYSDHTLGIEVPIAAVAMGATIIEKHFTLDRTLPGPDHSFALEPSDLGKMISRIRNVECAVGDGHKAPMESELDHRLRGRRSLFAAVDIAAGALITEEMIAVLRPGVGLSPRHYDEIIGATARVAVARHEPLTWSTVAIA